MEMGGKMNRAVMQLKILNTITLCLALSLADGVVDAAVADEVRPFLETHCYRCHGPGEQESDLRLDQLALATSSEESAATWAAVAELVSAGDMPPEGELRPEPGEVRRFLYAIRLDLASASPPVPGLRRLNRVEYEYTVHDLLGINASLADLLPEDASVQGFDNVAGGLGLSAVLLERYLEAADVAFESTIRRIKPLPAATRRAVLMEHQENIDSVKQKKGGVIELAGAFIDFTPGWPPARIDEAHPIEDGLYRCRIAVWPHEPGPHRTLAVAVFAGPLFGPGKRDFMGIYDVTGTPENPRIIEFTTRLSEGHTLHILPWIHPEHVTWRDKDEPQPGVAIAWAETHGPLDQSFPSESQQELFGSPDSISLVEGWPVYIRHRRGAKSHNVASTAPYEDAERIIRRLAPRAFRRPVPEELVDPFVQLTRTRLDQGSTFEQAVRAGVTAILSSPHFLLINAEPDVDDFTLASRLSYFLWSSLPDDELMQLAAEGRLSDPAVRQVQVDRMIRDPKIERFVVNFTGQWLDLRSIEFTTPDAKLYPEYDALLLRSMLAETHGFFRHLLDHDLSVMNFIDSDFAILNQRMATQYGLAGVRGHEQFRVVRLPEDTIRGGVLTQASVLKVTANGTSTSPVVRGAWVLENLLGQPAPPPPAGVPAVEPDIRGATTIRAQLELHRADATCARCHARIDPPGFALEEFDVIGGHRRWYRSLGSHGERIPKTNYRAGPAVESHGELPDGRAFANFSEFRKLLLADPDRIARAFAEELLVYGCGRPVSPADEAIVDQVVDASRSDDFGLRSMIHAVVDSELFARP